MNNSDAVQNFRFFRFWAEILQIVTFAFKDKNTLKNCSSHEILLKDQNRDHGYLLYNSRVRSVPD